MRNKRPRLIRRGLFFVWTVPDSAMTIAADMNLFFARLIALLIMTPFFSCAVLFWKDASNSSGGTWKGNDRFIEIQTEFQRKSSWYPLNQNALTRNYSTTLLLHKVSGEASTSSEKIAHYAGWTLNDTLFLAGSSLIAIRGTSNSLGDENRELLSVSLKEGAVADASVILKPDGFLLAAVPSPDGKWIAAFLTDATNEKRTGNLFIDFYEFRGSSSLQKKSRVTVQWSGVPGNPELSWSRDSQGLYLHVESAVLYVAAGGSTARNADRFPACFIPTSSGRNISESGLFFGRSQEGQVEIRKTNEGIRFDAIPMVNNINDLGKGCP